MSLPITCNVSPVKKSSLLDSSAEYKPFRYPWAYEAWAQQQKMHWISEEIPMSDDVKDWSRLNPAEKNLLTQILRFFTQSDIEVNNCYMTNYMKVFKRVEIRMMLSAFSNIETIHIDAYAKLIETVGMPEVEYKAFLQCKEMSDKYEYMQKFDVNNLKNIALTLAVFGAFTEGLQLFSSFAILLNFPRFNKMKGMGQIVTWSVRDESLHTASIIKLFKTFLEENPEINTRELREEIYQACMNIVEFEDAFIDRAFEIGDVEGLSSLDVKKYVRYLADRRLLELGFNEIYMIKSNPLPWLEEMLNASEFANFFETRATNYAKSNTSGTWDAAYSDLENSLLKNKNDIPRSL